MSKGDKAMHILESSIFEHYLEDSMEEFIIDNIQRINQCQSAYEAKKIKAYFKANSINKPIYFTNTDITTFLKIKFKNYITSDDNKSNLIIEFKNHGLISDEKISNTIIKSKLLEIANDNYFLISSITDFYNAYILNHYLDTLRIKEYRDNIMEAINSVNAYIPNQISKVEQKYIQNNLKKSMLDYLYLAFSNGFTKNIIISNPGVTSANEGDAAQFLFVARAMLAGFNCSNVDLRSSRYDAVIDINDKILRVQVKGISDDSINFKNRNRGGEGNDPNSNRNKGKIISSKDIDLYVAVQKNTGICYIIPAKKIDEIISQLINQNKKTLSYSTSNLQYYKENWNIIYEVSKNK